MRVQLSESTIDSLENLTGKKVSKNGDEIIQRVCDIASGDCNKTGAWVEPEPKENKNESP